MTAILGSVLVLTASTALGFGVAADKRRRTLMAEGFLELVRHVEDSLPGLAPLEDIVSLFRNEALERYGVLERVKEKSSVLPCNKRLETAIELTRDDTGLYGILQGFVKELGSTDYDRQLKGLQTARAALTSLSRQRRQELEKGERCYKYLGILGGALAVILLI